MFFSTLFTIFLFLFYVSNCNAIVPYQEQGIVKVPLSFVQTAYVAEISIGTPKQTVHVEVATIHQGLWTSSANCRENYNYCRGGYNRKASKTSTIDGRKVIKMIEGTQYPLEGILVRDTITLNGDNAAENLNFGLMPDVDEHFFYQTNVSGSLGLGLGVRSDSATSNLVDSLFDSSSISSKVLGFNLKRAKFPDDERMTAKHQSNMGEVTIGSPVGDRSLIKSDPIWVDGQEIEMENSYDYFLRVDGFDVNSKPLHCTGENECMAAIDISSIFIKLPEHEVFTLANVLGFIPFMGTTFFTDCKRMDYLPNVDIAVGGLKVSIPASDYMIKTKPPSPILYSKIFSSENVGYRSIDGEDDGKVCMLRFIGHEIPNLIVLGQPFLYNVYTLIDHDKKRFGFAELK